MQAIYGDQCVDVSKVRRWVRQLKRWSLQWGNGLKEKKNANFFKDRFLKLVQRWQKCIEVLVIL